MGFHCVGRGYLGSRDSGILRPRGRGGGGGGSLCGEAIGNIANAQSRKMWRRGFIPEDRGIPEKELLVAFSPLSDTG